MDFCKTRLDHGELSIPNRTKNINKELDKYKAEQAKIEKREREDRRFLAQEQRVIDRATESELKAEAWAQYKQHGKAMAVKYADKLGDFIPPREQLKDMAKFDPKRFLKLVSVFLLS